MSRIFFLGSGGGRWNTIAQQRATGGFRIELESERIHVDPGPGAIVRCREFGINARKTDAVACTHCHIDHYNDVEILVEAMSMGEERRGVLLGSKSVIEGFGSFESPVSSYHRGLPKRIEVLEAGREVGLGECSVVAAATKHEDPACCGLRFRTKYGDISYTSDTEYFDGLPDAHKGARVLIINVMRPDSSRIPGHLCTDDAVRLVAEASPRTAILQHFGMKMIFANPQMQARRVEKETGVRTIPANDGMEFGLGTEEQATLAGFGK